MASFSGRAVQNVVDVTAPAFEQAATAADGGSVVVTFDEALDGGSAPAPGAFAVSVDGTARTTGGVAVAGATVTLTLAAAVTHGQAVTVSYAKPASGAALRDAAGNAVASFAGQAVSNATADPDAPVVTGVAIISDAGPDETYALGQKIRVQFDVRPAGARRRRAAAADRLRGADR